MKTRLAAGLMLGVVGLSAAVYAADSGPRSARAMQLLKARLPKTDVTAIDCDKVDGICEVVAGKSLFYIDHSARFLLIGRVYDMQLRQDLTAGKLLELNPGLLLGGAANSVGSQDDDPATLPSALPAALGRGTQRPAAEAQSAAPRVDLSGLPASGAIRWGKAAGTPVTIFTDFHCGYCRALATQLEGMDVNVTERPISTLGSRDIANRVLCSRDRQRAIKAAYNGEPLPAAACDTSGLDANERFAREHGFSGTPVLVRADGAVLEGFRPREVLEAWLRGGR